MVHVRDVRHALPLALQLGLFVTPVVYSFDSIQPKWRPLYSILNPMAPVIDSYRSTILLGEALRWGLLGLGALSSAVALVIGFVAFKRLETSIADVG